MIPRLTEKQIRSTTENILKSSGLFGNTPIDVEFLAEDYFGLQIQPVNGLSYSCQTEGMLLSDLKTIIFSEDCAEVRIRFTIAHELGHLVLHPDYIQNLNAVSIADWMSKIKNFPQDDYAQAEWQANMFAGFLLMPEDALYTEVQSLKSILTPFKQQNFSEKIVREYVANSLARTFSVAPVSMIIRLSYMEKSIYNLI